jgi:hypothetical protein
MHVLPVLRQLEARYSQKPFVVIGVHSGKFLSELEPANVRKAVARLGISHPVAVDSAHDVWERYAVKAWPTLVLVDPAGRIVGHGAGEPTADALSSVIEQTLARAQDEGTLTGEPFALSPQDDPGAMLRFPGKVLATPDRLYIADSGHHRIVCTDHDGAIVDVIGSGEASWRDGPFSSASFHHPQGLAILDGDLIVADTENHRIRRAFLEDGRVETLAGTGKKGAGPISGGIARDLDLRSPWALASVPGGLLIAMAGSHQICSFDVGGGILASYAGTGREDHVDGPVGESAFAQPSGLARAGRHLFVADAESSSVRLIDLEQAQVSTICGQGLFDYGDTNGTGNSVRMQHVLDVAAFEGVLYVADAYNNKVKRIDLESGRVETFLGDGMPEVLHEPGGVSVAAGKIFVADTNRHRVRVADLATRTLTTLDVRH